MSRNLIRFSVPLVGGAAVAFAFLGCSSDKAAPVTTEAGVHGSGGATGSSGSTGSSGAAGKGGGSSGGASPGSGGAKGDAGPDPYVCLNLPKKDPGGTGAANSPCCGGIGKCVDPTTLTASMKAAVGHDSCLPTLSCAPPAATAGDAGGVYDKCTAKLGADLEGRCLPKCFLLGNPQASQLAQETCGANMLCAPCFSPLDASNTGACNQKPGDAPTDPAPTAYAACGTFDGGSKDGLCVPKVLVDASGNASAPSLKQDDCANATDRCVPTLKAMDTAACFKECTTTLGTIGPQYGKGACVPSYIVKDVNPQGLAILTKGTCTGADELCAPCLDPLSTPPGKFTHSCE